MNQHERWLEQAEIYALDALDGAEMEAFEDHLGSGCPQCEARIREIREAAVLLCRNLPAAQPPAEIKKKLLKGLESKPQIRYKLQPPAAARIWSHWCGWSLATVALALIAAGSGYMAWLGQRAVRHMESRVVSMEARIRHSEAVADFLSDSATEVVRLKGLSPSPEASARVLWNPVRREGYLLASGLPALPEEKIYELWAISEAGPVPAGLFTVDETGQSFLKIETLPGASRFKTFAVTLEAEGGVQRPVGAMHLAGDIGAV